VSSPDFDRAAHRRTDAPWLEARTGTGRLVPVWHGRSLLGAAGEGPKAAVFPPASAAPGPLIFLGARGDETYFALGLEAPDEAAALAAIGLTREQARFTDLRQQGGLLAPFEGHVLAYAKALTHWHGEQLFCGRCGHATAVESAGHVRTCTNPSCATKHFPRTDPATIMLVHDGDRCLLGRQPGWPPGMYSTLAGFVEPGETVEEAVAREVLEESGIVTGAVRYRGSQPWPYPRSLMLGFFAEARTSAIERGDELEDVRWFTRDEARALVDRLKAALPGVDTIARRLIGAWLEGTT
jgi:NAD+ diphosphatase